ncbi:hypothetical protein N8I77_005239 [Diaporthe amygdali]|uniref:Beta-lactamase-related domain-containing protein n=1 Tax=Phomopsis amygdali TaxID=1214568 RepID=A0AAD9SE68_PHOAM|nr:hypothetical protein N8I77_005239 [Diaporthe amygdali]
MQHFMLFWPLLVLTCGSASRIVASDQVPLLGPSFISNFNSSKSGDINEAKLKLPDVIEDLFSSGDLNRIDLIFAVDVFSASTNESIYSYYHVGEGQEYALTEGTLDDQTVSRIGSVSKLFTAHVIIARAGIEVFSHPVTRYLPELARNLSNDSLQKINWKDISVGTLISQQAGSGGTGGFFEYTGGDEDKQTPQAFLEYMRDQQRPVIPPSWNAVYSDGGFVVLGQTMAPVESDANVINRSSQANSSWAYDIPLYTGTGSVYTSLADLRATGLSILNSELLSPITTREWMKPHSGTGSVVKLVGAPWEITRLMIPVNPALNRTRVCDIYIKSGGNVDYTSVIALSPDHGLGFSILVAGFTASHARWPLRDALGETFVRAAEYAAVKNAQDNLSGIFVSNSSEGTNITLTMDEDQPGLQIKSFYISGEDALENSIAARLYPTRLYSGTTSSASLYKFNGTSLNAHRMVFSELPLPPRAAVEGGDGGNLFDHSFAWMGVGLLGAGDGFIFEIVNERLMSIQTLDSELVFHRVES